MERTFLLFPLWNNLSPRAVFIYPEVKENLLSTGLFSIWNQNFQDIWPTMMEQTRRYKKKLDDTIECQYVRFHSI